MLAAAVTSAGPDAHRDSLLELVIGVAHWTFKFGAIRGAYRELIEAANSGLLAECEESVRPDGGYGEVVLECLDFTDPDPIYAFDPERALIPHLISDFGIKDTAVYSRIIDVRAWGFPDPAADLVSLASMYGIRFTPTGRAQDEAAVIKRISEVRDARLRPVWDALGKR